MSVADLRKEYTQHGLLEADLAADPIAQFEQWFGAALAAGLPEPNAMTLATATADGRPSARMVLIKGADARGFVFYTNTLSRKGHELAENPYAALVFFWPELERQIRVEGRVASNNGTARVDLDVVQVGGASLKGRALDLLVRTFVLPLYPNAKVGSQFELGYNVDRIELKQGLAQVTMAPQKPKAQAPRGQ